MSKFSEIYHKVDQFIDPKRLWYVLLSGLKTYVSKNMYFMACQIILSSDINEGNCFLSK